LENQLSQFYEREAALLFNSGYHANIGILPALTTSASLILSDKLVQASLIDGISLSRAKHVRYRHNDYEQLERLLHENAPKHDLVFVVTESLFSMDGDISDLKRLVSLKKHYPNLLLYADEAHAVGVRGGSGRGVAEEQQVIPGIDILVGTFGKALASVGAFAVTHRKIKELLINSARSFIFTTALPPVNICWSKFILDKIPFLTKEREHLSDLQRHISKNWKKQMVTSHIFPCIVGESSESVRLAGKLQGTGFYALPIRPPTVPEGSARIRFSLTAQMTVDEVDRLVEIVISNAIHDVGEKIENNGIQRKI
jgi:8-amino-7-oxononanoate synthase